MTTMPFYIHRSSFLAFSPRIPAQLTKEDGMVYVPIGYANQAVGSVEVLGGGSPWGASTITASDGHLQPTKSDLEIAEFQGKVSYRPLY